MLKRIIITILGVIFVSTSVCLANMQIVWNGLNGFTIGGVPIFVDCMVGYTRADLQPGAAVVQSNALAQLIYSPDSSLGAPDLGNAANGWVSGNDYVISTYIVNNATNYGEYGLFDAGTYVNTTSVGYVFGRLYQTTNPVGGLYYYDTYGTNILDVAGIVFPNILDFTPGVTTDMTQMLPVPEPGSMALYGLGLAVLAFRRKTGKK